MALTASPYGLKPINLIGGGPFAGSTRNIPITSGYAANIYYGSVVYVTAAGVLNIVTGTGADATTNAWPVGSSGTTGAIGVFLGCSYTNPGTKQKVFSQFWPTGTVASDAVGIVCDDDRVVFQVQSAGTVAATELGANFFFSAAQSTSTGSTTTGNSTSAVCTGANSIATTAPFRCVGFVDMQGFSVVGDAFTDILVKINTGWHSYSCVAGL